MGEDDAMSNAVAAQAAEERTDVRPRDVRAEAEQEELATLNQQIAQSVAERNASRVFVARAVQRENIPGWWGEVHDADTLMMFFEAGPFDTEQLALAHAQGRMAIFEQHRPRETLQEESVPPLGPEPIAYRDPSEDT